MTSIERFNFHTILTIVAIELLLAFGIAFSCVFLSLQLLRKIMAEEVRHEEEMSLLSSSPLRGKTQSVEGDRRKEKFSSSRRSLQRGRAYSEIFMSEEGL